jgi:hypothetical protein
VFRALMMVECLEYLLKLLFGFVVDDSVCMLRRDVVQCRTKTGTLEERTPYFIHIDSDTLNNFENTMIVIMPSLGHIHKLST